MGRDQRLKRAGVIRKESQAPSPEQYWKERAKYFEGVVLAMVVCSPGETFTLKDVDLRGCELEATKVEEGVLMTVKRTQVPAQDLIEKPEEAKVLVVHKARAGGITPMIPSAAERFCMGGEEGPICHGATGPHVHPPGFSGTPIRAEQLEDEEEER